MSDKASDDVDRVVALTNRHVWRQIGMTGSDHDRCVLCGANTGGLGIEADPRSLVPCVYRIHFRRYSSGVQTFTVGR
jgi:hypothetical protein